MSLLQIYTKFDKKKQDIPPPKVRFPVEGCPEELKAEPRWVLWRWIWSSSGWKKPPLHVRKLTFARANDPSTWTDYETALQAYNQHFNTPNHCDGLGFMLGGGLCGVDLDKVYNLETKKLTRTAIRIITRLASYAEFSPTMTGCKSIVKASFTLADGKEGFKTALSGGSEIEIYSNSRYFTVTGWRVAERLSRVEDRQDVVDALVAEYGPPVTKSETQGKGTPITKNTLCAASSTPNHPEDDAVIFRALKGANKERFEKLFVEGDLGDYGNDHSKADLALVDLLLYYAVGSEEERIATVERLFVQSALCRTKWLRRADYRRSTITRALHCQQHHKKEFTPEQEAFFKSLQKGYSHE
ncbi:MAG: hypothetical protein U0736_25545 [Gemmataceae bacterium]